MPVLVNNSWDLLTPFEVKTGKDEGGSGLGPKEEYTDCVVAEYVWVDAAGVPRSKTKTLSKKPYDVDCLPVRHKFDHDFSLSYHTLLLFIIPHLSTSRLRLKYLSTNMRTKLNATHTNS